MPKISNERFADMFIADKCREIIGNKGSYIGHAGDVSDEGKVIVIAYFVNPKTPLKPEAMVVTDPAVLRASVKPDSVERPAKPAKEEAATPAKGSKK